MSVRVVRMSLLIGMLALVLGAVAAAPVQAQVAQPFTLEPGGTAIIDFEAFCIEFGRFFPAAITAPNGLAPDNVRAALDYIQRTNITASEADALQAQYAIWQLLNSPGSPATNSSIAQDVLANASTPPASPGGTSLLEAANAGNVSLSVTRWDALGRPVRILSATDNFFGRGTVEVRNTSNQTLELYMPVGTNFPASEERFQTVSGYPTNIVVNNPNLPSTSNDTALPLVSLLMVTALSLLGTGYLVLQQARALTQE